MDSMLTRPPMPNGHDPLLDGTQPPPPQPPTGNQVSRPPNRRPLLGIAAAILAAGLVGGAVGGGAVAVLDTPATATRTVVSAESAASAPAPTETDAPAATRPANTIAELVSTARPSVVAIHTSVAQTNLFGQTVEGQAAGTGFILTADGYIATNNHVIDGAEDISVDLSDGTQAPATVVGADPSSDLAVLKIDQSGLTPLTLGRSGDLEPGDQLVAIGNALDLSGEPTVTTGIVSATGRSLTEPNGVRLPDLIQTDTAINPGNSGGPLLDLDGDVVGINTVVAGQAQNIGFAIAIDHAKDLIDQLQAGEIPDHALLGIATRVGPGGTGAEVVEVTPDSSADSAGLIVGDVVTTVGDTRIDSPDDLGAAIAGHRPGDQIELTITRGATTETITATLGTRPQEDGS